MFPDEKEYYSDLLQQDSNAAKFVGLYWIVKAKKESVDVMRYADQHYEDTLSVWKGVKEYDKKVKLYLRIRDSEKQMCIESYIYDHWDEINKMISDKLDEVRKKKVDDKP